MSLSPYFFDYEPRWPRRLLEHKLRMTPTGILGATSPVATQFNPWLRDIGSSIKADKDKWQINVDVQHFAPDEIRVKIANGDIVVEGKHEEKEDEHGFISRQFVRRFKLPNDINPDVVESRLSSDGVLTVIAPKKAEVAEGVRAVPITHTGPVRTEVTVDPKIADSAL